VFSPNAVLKLLDKFRTMRAIGIKDNMALVGILSTQLVIDQFINNFPTRVSYGNAREGLAAVYRQ
jgi:asparagine synthase (glutamine-hydrolysing)